MDLAPPLRVGHRRASVFLSDRTGLKEPLIRGLWLTQAGGREGHGVRGEPAAAEAGVTFHSTPCVLPGKLSLDTGRWQWRAAQAPGRGGVDSDLCLHTGFLVAAVAALASHARLCGLRF